MLIRVLIILAMALPGLSLRAEPAPTSSTPCCAVEPAPAPADDACCLTPKPQPTHHCGMPAEDCVCGVRSAPAQPAPPKAPATRTGESHPAAPFDDDAGVEIDAPDEPAARPAFAVAALASRRTNNETQALLSVWRM